MKKLSQSSIAIFAILVVGIVTISVSSYSGNEVWAKPHASLIITPDESPDQKNANPITLVLGHTNEPAYGKLPGIHDGKHNVEVELSDQATTLPIQGNDQTEPSFPNTQIMVDKYYFKNIENFNKAQSLDQADAKELNVPLTPVFGQPGLFFNRQVIDPGIYGYTVKGIINYYGVASVPIEPTTKFCSTSGEDVQDTSKFDSPGWTGSYGCPISIKDIFFPPDKNYPNGDYPAQYPQEDNPAQYPQEDNPAQYPQEDNPAQSPQEDNPAQSPQEDNPAQ
ncbi:MAG TPA: hypothetical protein VJ697_08345 [Nitrososphaeraceae archaeon]|nr:hypothetical protein [Nitrososphaeraceae archaeon]